MYCVYCVYIYILCMYILLWHQQKNKGVEEWQKNRQLKVFGKTIGVTHPNVAFCLADFFIFFPWDLPPGRQSLWMPDDIHDHEGSRSWKYLRRIRQKEIENDLLWGLARRNTLASRKPGENGAFSGMLVACTKAKGQRATTKWDLQHLDTT